MSEELGKQLRTEIDPKIERAVRQQLDAPFLAVYESEIQGLNGCSPNGLDCVVGKKNAADDRESSFCSH